MSEGFVATELLAPFTQLFGLLIVGFFEDREHFALLLHFGLLATRSICHHLVDEVVHWLLLFELSKFVGVVKVGTGVIIIKMHGLIVVIVVL